MWIRMLLLLVNFMSFHLRVLVGSYDVLDLARISPTHIDPKKEMLHAAQNNVLLLSDQLLIEISCPISLRSCIVITSLCGLG